jgi:hypothetical protein
MVAIGYCTGLVLLLEVAMMCDFSADNFSRLSFFTFCVPLLAVQVGSE